MKRVFKSGLWSMPIGVGLGSLALEYIDNRAWGDYLTGHQQVAAAAFGGLVSGVFITCMERRHKVAHSNEDLAVYDPTNINALPHQNETSGVNYDDWANYHTEYPFTDSVVEE